MFLSQSPHYITPAPSLWKRYVDNTFLIIKTVHWNGFLKHINSRDQCIQFTEETPRADSSMSFLDTLVIPQPIDSLEPTVYRRPSHTDQYLHWESHHTITAKYSVVSTWHHRTRAVCSNPKLLQREQEHLQEAISKWNCPIWALNRMKIKIQNPNHSHQQHHIVIPYTKGLSKSLKNVCNKHRTQVYFRGGIPSKASWLFPEAKTLSPKKKSGVVYRFKFKRV